VKDWLSYDIVRFKIEVGIDAKCMSKNVTLNTRELLAVAGQRQPIAVAIFDDLHLRAQRRQHARAV